MAGRTRRLLPPVSARRCAVAAASCLVMLAAACGGSSPSHVALKQNGPLAFADCMRSHGVPNWPDPESNGTFDKRKLTSQQLGASDTTVQSAQTACRHLLPAPSAAQRRNDSAQALQFSRCMRAHGVASFPDPDSSGRIPDSFGMSQGSPTFQAANNACAGYRPPYVPSNSAYNAWARTHSTGS